MNKLIVFDLDNTLTVGNSWARLNIGLGMTVKEDMRLSNEYQKTQNFSKWTVAIMNIYRQQGIPTKKQIEDILGNFQYMTGAKKCVKKFKKAGYVTAIISGSPNIFTEIICKDLDINHFKSVYSLIFNESGFLKDIVASDKEKLAKLKFCEEICGLVDVDIKKTIIVGDGDNEELLFKSSNYSITFKGSKLENKAWRTINTLADLSKMIIKKCKKLKWTQKPRCLKDNGVAVLREIKYNLLRFVFL